ncbi:MAG: YqcI/YcgG family protein [Candidatus Eremiobacteraeota bacterium]|nr:YqcI/YcgG family protein [Candidatus Eremiobacteraeota bacterium]
MNIAQAISLYESHNPFTSALALANSNYSACIDGELVRLLDWRDVSARARLAHAALQRFIAADDYPCVGAKAVANRRSYRFGVYQAMGSEAASAGLAHDLCSFSAERPLMQTEYASFIAVFDDIDLRDERCFEAVFWEQLSDLARLGRPHFAWDPAVSSDPQDPTFAFSFAGAAYFVVGMHPGSSRLARRFAWPAIAFNARAQFDVLRARGIYDRFKTIVRARDRALQGSLNPNLAEFGEVSEARQYAGRAVEPAWRCPFRD